MNNDLNNEEIAISTEDSSIEETEDKKAVTRSIHITTPYTAVTVTTQDEKEDIHKIKKIAKELMKEFRDYHKSN